MRCFLYDISYYLQFDYSRNNGLIKQKRLPVLEEALLIFIAYLDFSSEQGFFARKICWEHILDTSYP